MVPGPKPSLSAGDIGEKDLVRKRKHERKWSNGLNRNFTEEELVKFLSVINNPKHRLCYQLQAYLVLRISEAVKVNVSNIDFRNKQIRVYAPKTRSIEWLPLHEKIYKIIVEWVQCRGKELDESDDPSKIGINLAADIIKNVHRHCNGVHMMSLGWEDKVPEILRKAGMKP
jgi:integrase